MAGPSEMQLSRLVDEWFDAGPTPTNKHKAFRRKAPDADMLGREETGLHANAASAFK